MLNWLSDKINKLNDHFEKIDGYINDKAEKSWEGKTVLPNPITTDLDRQIGGGFDLNAFREQVRKRFEILNLALVTDRLNNARNFVSDGLFNQLRRQIEIQTLYRRKSRFVKQHFHSLSIVGFENDPFYNTIHAMVYSTSRTSHGYNEHHQVFSFRCKPGRNNTIINEGYCPNCGGPMELASDVVQCPFCQALVNSGYYGWVLSEISDAADWRPPQARMIPGLVRLQKTDTTFCIQNAEDRMRSYFWQLQECMLSGNYSAIGTIGINSFCRQFLHFRNAEARDATSKVFCDVDVSTVELVLVDFEDDNVHLVFTVGWQGVQGQRRHDGHFNFSGHPSPKRQCYTMTRKLAAIPKLDCGLSSLSCVNCGGPLSYTEEGDCQYCGTRLNSPEVDWVLTAMPNYCDINREIYRKQKELRELRAHSKEIPVGLINDKIGLLAGLVGMAAADGEISQDEYKLLQRYVEILGLDREILDGILEDVCKRQLEVPLPRNNEEARAWIKALIDISLSDRYLSEVEERFLTELAQDFNFSKLDIQMLMRREATERNLDG